MKVWPGHQHAVVRGGELGQVVGVLQARGERLLDEHVLAGFQSARGASAWWVCGGVAITTASIAGSTRSGVEVAHGAGVGMAPAEEVAAGRARRSHRPPGAVPGIRPRCARGWGPSSRSRHRGAERLLRGRARSRGAAMLSGAGGEAADQTFTPPPGDRGRPARSSAGCAGRAAASRPSAYSMSKLHHLVVGALVAPAHLPQAGQAGLDGEARAGTPRGTSRPRRGSPAGARRAPSRRAGR